MRQHWTLLISLLLYTLSSSVSAQGFKPTAAQIQQLNAMSTSEKKALAKSVGVEIPEGALDQNNQPNLSDNPDNQSPDGDDANIEDSEMDDMSDRELHEDEDKNKDDDEKRISENNLALFGHELFKQKPDSFRPSSALPVPANYVLGPGDNIVIQLYGKENNSFTLTVNREGQIQFPQIGPVNLAGLTFTQAQSTIDEIVSKQMIGIKSSVTMGALRSIRVFVLGEVKTPGSFSISALSNITNALFASGGITEVGSLRKIQLKRDGKVVSKLDLYDLLIDGNTSADVRLLPGDVIFVPPIGTTVQISGEVARPARYELAKPTTAGELLQIAGGIRSNAYPVDSSLVRINQFGERSFIDLDLSSQKDKSFRLKKGDKLKVGRILDFVHDQITLRGNFKRPGLYSWRQGMRFTDLIPSPFNMMPGSDMNIALIQTMSLETGDIEAKLFSPAAAWSAPHTAVDPKLNTYDEIFVFDLHSERPPIFEELVELMRLQAKYRDQQKSVTISGSVRFPGIYPLTIGMTTEDLIMLAGGLSESALGTTGEITRHEISDNLERVVMHISVELSGEGTQLHPGDTLQVKQIPLWKQKESVEIVGEVMFPGTYSILPGESLMDVLTRAGGLTPHAYTLGAIFSRAYLRQLEEERLAELKEKLESDMAIASSEEKVGQKAINIEEAGKLLEKLDSTKPLGRMVIDLPMILENPSEHDFQLEDGDVLTIPRFKPSVTVIGEVQYPTSHFFDKKLGTAEYIKRSGGTKKNADKSRIYIVKANGRVTEPTRSSWFRSRSETIDPGDTIVVPLDTDRVDALEVWAKATQIVYQAALGAAAVGSL